MVKNRTKWDEISALELDAIRNVSSLLNLLPNKCEELKVALSSVYARGTALRILLTLETGCITELMAELIELASVGHSDIVLCRKVIRTLPRQKLLDNFILFAEPILMSGGEEEYRRLAELASEIDPSLCEQIARMALNNSDQNVIEVGRDFL